MKSQSHARTDTQCVALIPSLDRNYQSIVKILLVLMVCIGFYINLFGQLSGNYTVDRLAPETITNYTSLTDLLEDLRSGGRNNILLSNGPGISSAVNISVSNIILSEPIEMWPVAASNANNRITLDFENNPVLIDQSISVGSSAFFNLRGIDYLTIKNLKIAESSLNGFLLSSSVFLIDRQSDFITIEECDITSNLDNIIFVSGITSNLVSAHNLTIRNNTFTVKNANRNIGIGNAISIWINEESLPAIKNLTISNNYIAGNILAVNANFENLIISGNNFQSSEGIHFFGPEDLPGTTEQIDAIITNNIFNDNSLGFDGALVFQRCNIDPTSTSTIQVYNNIYESHTLHHTSLAGRYKVIILENSRQVEMYHNTFNVSTASPSVSTVIYECQLQHDLRTTTFKNNIVNLKTNGITNESMLYRISDMAYFNTNNFDNNVVHFQDSLDNVIMTQTISTTGTRTNYSPTEWTAYSGQDAHTILTDPLFADASNGNYTPTNSAIHNVFANIGVSKDINGVPRMPWVEPGAIEISNYTDIGVTNVTYLTGCETGVFDIAVEVTNFGDTIVDNFDIYTFTEKSLDNHSKTTSISSANLAPGSTQTFTINNVLNTSPCRGSIDFLVNTINIKDLDLSNDSNKTTQFCDIPTISASVSIDHNESSICADNPVEFYITNQQSAGKKPTYQWLVNGSPISGATSSSFSTSSLNDQDQVTLAMTSSEACVQQKTVLSNTLIQRIIDRSSVYVEISPLEEYFCEEDTVVLNAAHIQNEGKSPEFKWFVNGIYTGQTDQTFASGNLLEGDIVSLEMTSSKPCPIIPTAGDEYEVGFAETPDINFTIEPLTQDRFKFFNITPDTQYLTWDFGDGTPVSEENPVEHTFSTTGTYTVCATVQNINGCEETHCKGVGAVTSIGEAQKTADGFKVYPNPAQQQVNILYAGGEVFEGDISLYDVTGKQVWNKGRIKIAHHQKMELDIENLSPGIYTLKIGKQQSVKLIVKPGDK